MLDALNFICYICTCDNLPYNFQKAVNTYIMSKINIKIQILICCPHMFSIEAVGRIC